MSAGTTLPDAAPPASATLGLPRWARAPAALALGAALPLAYAPLHWLPVLPLALAGLFLLWERTGSARGAAALGWCFGFGSFVVGLAWIAESFSVDPDRFGGLAVPAVAGLSAGLALFPALALAAARVVSGRAAAGAARWPGLLAFVAALSGGEWLRGTVLTGFPWNLAGTAWGFADAPMQFAAVAGLHGLGLLTLLAATLPALCVRPAPGEGAAPSRFAPALLALGLAGALWGFGAWRLAAPPPDAEGVTLRLVQPGVAQGRKWDPAEAERILTGLVALSVAPGAAPTHVVWPESAVPALIEEDAPTRAWIAQAAPPGGALLTGAVRRGAAPDGGRAMLNSLVALSPDGEITAAYDKIRLVPFGEFMPLRAWFPGLRKVAAGEADFTPGRFPRPPLAAAGLPPAWPLICYEAAFPEPPSDAAASAARWILNVTNDGWFGTSWGPHQHFLAARFRAVELGLPLVRAANTGISAVTDARGAVRDLLPLGARGILDAALPGPLPGGTPYARWGDAPYGAAVAALLLLAVVGARRRRDANPLETPP